MEVNNSKKRVGILRGGAGKHYVSSLKKGGEIISHISKNLADKYKVFDILIDPKGFWHINGIPIMPADLIRKVDLIWNASHPGFSNILKNLSIPNVGVSFFSWMLVNNQDMLRTHLTQIGVSMPRHIIFPKSAREVFEKFSSPWIVRSLGSDSDMGVHLAKTFKELIDALEDGVKHQTSILVEEFISGKVASVHSVPSFRGENIYIFPVWNVFGNLSPTEKEKLSNIAKDLHSHLGAKHYLKSSFVLNKRGKVYLLNIDSTLDPREDSYFSKVCESVGTQMHQVIEHILEQAE